MIYFFFMGTIFDKFTLLMNNFTIYYSFTAYNNIYIDSKKSCNYNYEIKNTCFYFIITNYNFFAILSNRFNLRS